MATASYSPTLPRASGATLSAHREAAYRAARAHLVCAAEDLERIFADANHGKRLSFSALGMTCHHARLALDLLTSLEPLWAETAE